MVQISTDALNKIMPLSNGQASSRLGAGSADSRNSDASRKPEIATTSGNQAKTTGMRQGTPADEVARTQFSDEAGALLSTEQSEQGQADLDMDMERLREVISKVQSMATSVRFDIHKVDGDVLVKVVNRESGETVRQIPPEEVVKLRERMTDIRGLLFENVS